MTNLLNDIPCGEPNEYINTVVEIPKGSSHKIEYEPNLGIFVLDRVEPDIFAKPVNYGFIPQTLDEDGDALDTLVITDEPLATGILVKAKVIAVLNFVDDSENDHKVICIPKDERNLGDWANDLDELNSAWKLRLEHHFNHYKDLKKPGTTKVVGWGGRDDAWSIIKECSNRFQKSSK